MKIPPRNRDLKVDSNEDSETLEHLDHRFPRCNLSNEGPYGVALRFTGCEASWHRAPVSPSVADVLELDAIRSGRPRVVAGVRGLGRPVRWTHVAEVLDIAHLLRGGELLLSTGVAFPEDDELAEQITALAASGTSGLVVELGRRYVDALPSALLNAADAQSFPVIELRRETPFVQVTESVHALVVGAQLTELRASEEVHRTFTELSLEGADAHSIVRHTARMAGVPVVLESLNHQVLAFDPAGSSADQLLDRWESRSRSVNAAGRTSVDLGLNWVVVVVGARGTDWGRLVVVADGPPTTHHVIVAERAAGALALDRLVEREHESLERQSHRTLLLALMAKGERATPSGDLLLRAAALGVPMEGKTFVAVVVRSPDPASSPLAEQATVRQLGETAARSLRTLRVQGLVAALDESSVGIMLTGANGEAVEAELTRVAARIRRDLEASARADAPIVVAAGSTVTDVVDIRRSFLEAEQVADLADPNHRRPVHRLTDVGLSGLLHLLRDDERVQMYVERELGPVLRYDATHDSDLLRALRIYLESGRNKSLAASDFGLSRPAFYERLHTLEALLDADLDDVDTCLTLHVALAALDSVRGAG